MQKGYDHMKEARSLLEKQAIAANDVRIDILERLEKDWRYRRYRYKTQWIKQRWFFWVLLRVIRTIRRMSWG